MAHAIALPRLGQQVGSVGHALHAPRDGDVRAACQQEVMRQHGRLHAGAAHLVDRRGASPTGHTGPQRSLPRGRLPLPGRQHAPHDDLIHHLRVYAGPFQRGADRRGAKLRRRGVGQLPLKRAHRRPGGADYDDWIVFAHFCTP